MKKLFALVLTLALVFAVAAPAMAASWGDTETPAGADAVPFAVSVKLLQPTKTTAPDGSTYYAEYPANLGVVANTPVRFMVSFSIPSQAELEAYYGYAAGTLPTGTLAATIVVANINNVQNTGTPVGALTSVPAEVTGKASKITLTGATYGGEYVLYYTGTIMATKEATVTAKLAFDGVISAGDPDATPSPIPAVNLTKKVGATDYIISTTGISAVGGTARSLEFTLGAADLITGWKLTVGTDTYTVAAGPVFVNDATHAVVDSTSTGYAALLAAYNELTGVLGFKYGDKVYYSKDNILAFFGFSGEVGDVKTYKAYTASLTVTDGSTVPNTGDSVSVIGFVMVGLALLATAAVVVKKVRA